MPSQDYSTRQDRAADAGSLLGHRIFQDAVTSLRTGLVLQLMALPLNDPKVFELHAKAKLIDELVGELQAFVADAKMTKPSGGEF